MGFCYKCSICIVILAILISLSPVIYYKLDQREFNGRSSAEQAAKGNNFNDKIIIVTGSSAGIGTSTTQILTQHGATVIMACRNVKKANKVRQNILLSINKPIDYKQLIVMKLDLANLQSINDFVNEFTSKYSSLHMLINNAGIVRLFSYETTDNAIELNFGVNHLGHFYLTQQLTPLLSKTSGITRVINVASYSYNDAPTNMTKWLISDDEYRRNGSLYCNYGISKACNIIYSREYNKRYGKGSNGIYSVSLHPGFIKTDITSTDSIVNALVALCKIFGFTKTLNQGAATTIRVAAISDDEFVKYGGKYFQDCNQIDLNRKDLIQDGENSDKLGELLWDLTIKIIQQKGFDL